MRKLNRLAITAALSVVGAAWMQAQTQIDLGRQGRNVDFSGATKTKPLRSGISLPTNCEPGEMFFKADAAAEQGVYVCGPQDTWVMVGKELPSAGMSLGKVLVVGEQGAQWKAVGGDAAGTIEALTVRGLRGRPVSEAVPSDGDVLSWSGALAAWLPAPPQGQYEPGSGVMIAGRAIAVDDATVPRYSTGAGAPAGACQSGRDFYVDLSAKQLYFCAAADEWREASGTSWGAITGQISNQTDLSQALSSKADATHSHNAGGDVTGDLSSLTVTRIQSRPVSAAAPTDGQALVWDQAGNQWRPATLSGGSGGWDPMDETNLVLREEFCGGGTASGQVGALGWSMTTIQGTSMGPDYGPGGTNNPCTVSIGVSSTNANDGRALYLNLNVAPFHNITGRGDWEARFVWQHQDAATEVRTRVGLAKFNEANTLVPPNFMGVRLDHDANWEPAGTTLIATVCNNNAKSSCTDYDTGVTLAQGGWYKLRIWSEQAGVIKMQVNEGSVITFSNPPTLPGNTIDFQPVFIMGRTGGTGNRRIMAEFFAGRISGLTR